VQPLEHAQTLGHFFAFGVDDKSVVHPVMGKIFAECNRLSAFVLMMRKSQVGATAMQIKTFAK